MRPQIDLIERCHTDQGLEDSSLFQCSSDVILYHFGQSYQVHQADLGLNGNPRQGVKVTIKTYSSWFVVDLDVSWVIEDHAILISTPSHSFWSSNCLDIHLAKTGTKVLSLRNKVDGVLLGDSLNERHSVLEENKDRMFVEIVNVLTRQEPSLTNVGLNS